MAGQATGQRLLSSAMRLAGGGWLLGGEIAAAELGWLADHAIQGHAVVAASVWLEVALEAAAWAGCDAIGELTLHTPLPIDGAAAVQLQVTVSGHGEEAGELSIHALLQRSEPHAPEPAAAIARADATARPVADASAEWVHCATGRLAPKARSDPAEEQAGSPPAAWPPPATAEVDTDTLYERLLLAGYEYGPAFRGLRRAWRSAGQIHAEVALDDRLAESGAGFLVHPALADAALQASLLDADPQAGHTLVPVAFADVRVMPTAATSPATPGAVTPATATLATATPGATARVSVERRDESTFALSARAGDGSPLLEIAEMRLMPADWRALPGGERDLYRLGWLAQPTGSPRGALPRLAALASAPTDVPGVAVHRDLAALRCALDAGDPAPAALLVPARALAPCHGEESPSGADVHELTAAVLDLLQRFLQIPSLERTRLLLVSERAAGVLDGEAPDLAQAALVGLLRSAHTEHPTRFALLDADAPEIPRALLQHVLASREPELAIRDGALYAPRLARAEPAPRGSEARALDPGATVLLTGATGGLGSLLARHLAREHRVRHLLLLNRSGPDTEAARALEEQLRHLGAEPQVVACDLGDRAQLAALIEAIPPGRPLGAVFHTAGVLADATLEALDPGRLRTVMAPKIDAAINLDELTAGLDLSDFVLYSSAAGIIGGAGQANYAAANTFLDALAHSRRARGLPALALAWGTWESSASMVGSLRQADRCRLERLGIAPLQDAHGLALLDAARAHGAPLLAPVRLRRAALRAQANAGTLPAPLLALLPLQRSNAHELAEATARRLRDARGEERARLVRELLAEQLGDVLGHDAHTRIDPRRNFLELGLDSLTAVELRNRLSTAVGLRLPTLLAFDHPTLAAAGEYILAQLDADETGAGGDAVAAEVPPAEAGELDDLLQTLGLATGGDGA